jgi:hypothetical protein
MMVPAVLIVVVAHCRVAGDLWFSIAPGTDHRERFDE